MGSDCVYAPFRHDPLDLGAVLVKLQPTRRQRPSIVDFVDLARHPSAPHGTSHPALHESSSSRTSRKVKNRAENERVAAFLANCAIGAINGAAVLGWQADSRNTG